MKFITSRAFRKWFYNVMLAVGALLVVYGVVTVEQAGAWGVVIAAIAGMARGNLTPEDSKDEPEI